MARGNIENKQGKRRHTYGVIQAAGELAYERMTFEDTDWTGNTETLMRELSRSISLVTEIEGRSRRMDRDGSSRRAACESIVMQAAAVTVEY